MLFGQLHDDFLPLVLQLLLLQYQCVQCTIVVGVGKSAGIALESYDGAAQSIDASLAQHGLDASIPDSLANGVPVFFGV